MDHCILWHQIVLENHYLSDDKTKSPIFQTDNPFYFFPTEKTFHNYYIQALNPTKKIENQNQLITFNILFLFTNGQNLFFLYTAIFQI